VNLDAHDAHDAHDARGNSRQALSDVGVKAQIAAEGNRVPSHRKAKLPPAGRSSHAMYQTRAVASECGGRAITA